MSKLLFDLEDYKRITGKDWKPTFFKGGYHKGNIPQSLRLAVFRRDDFQCVRCGAETNLCADHIIPESKGGKTILENLQTLCRTCNAKKGNRE